MKRKDEYLLGAVQHDSEVVFTIPAKDYFPQGTAIDVKVCSCIRWRIKTDGNIECKMATTKLPVGINNKASNKNMTIITKDGNDTEKRYQIKICSLVTREDIRFKP